MSQQFSPTGFKVLPTVVKQKKSIIDKNIFTVYRKLSKEKTDCQKDSLFNVRRRG